VRDATVLHGEQPMPDIAALAHAVHAAAVATADSLMGLIIRHANRVVRATLFVVDESSLDTLGQCACDFLTTSSPVELVWLSTFANIDDLRRRQNGSRFGFCVVKNRWQRRIRIHDIKIPHL
jgi:hypothetical protein